MGYKTIKVWKIIHKYVWNFDFYCGKQKVFSGYIDLKKQTKKGEAQQRTNVVKLLMEEIWGRGHTVTM